MPLKVNVGLTKKIGESNYGSRGASVNVEMELESALASEPGKLQERIRQLFGIVRSSLAEELNGHGNGTATNGNGTAPQAPAHTNGNAAPRREGTPRPATQSQIKALHAIAKSQGTDLGKVLREQYHLRRPDDLSIREASALIDQLKQSENGGGT